MTTTPTPVHALDRCVRALVEGTRERRIEPPRALFWLATGLGGLPDALAAHVELRLAELDAPAPWCEATLHAGRLGGLAVWGLEDRSGEPAAEGDAPLWTLGLPAWLAARAGASLLVHTSAGSALAGPDGPRAPVGGVGLVRDHLNLAGETPLVGLGASRLGPLFPDLTTLHHLGLRRRALARAEETGLAVAEVVAACTPGPALETPAERRYYATAGADVAVQGLHWPLLAAAHAGLAALAIVAVTDEGDGPADVTALVETAGLQAHLLDDLLTALAPDLAEAAAAREVVA